MSSPVKKRKKMEEPTPQSNPIPSLPYDLVPYCTARVSRSYYPTLSLVSKSFRSLIASPELYKARSLSGHTESCLYVCVQPFGTDPTWYTLRQKPNPIPTLTHHNHKSKKKEKEKPRGYVSVKVPILNSPRARFSGLVSVGSDIYNIGSGSGYDNKSCVWVLDCVSHTWHEAPSMKVQLSSLSATVIDRKIYVAGIQSKSLKKTKNSLQVLDTRTQTCDWEPVPCSDVKSSFLDSRSACIDGKFHVRTEETVFGYSSDEGRWNLAEQSVQFMFSDSYCEIENVRYSVYKGALVWYDAKVKLWKHLSGLVGLPKFPRAVSLRLIGYGGKMVVLWDEKLPYSGQEKIWCVEIALERRGNWDIWGEVEWFDHILTLPIRYGFFEVVVATV